MIDDNVARAMESLARAAQHLVDYGKQFNSDRYGNALQDFSRGLWAFQITAKSAGVPLTEHARLLNLNRQAMERSNDVLTRGIARQRESAFLAEQIRRRASSDSAPLSPRDAGSQITRLAKSRNEGLVKQMQYVGIAEGGYHKVLAGAARDEKLPKGQERTEREEMWKSMRNETRGRWELDKLEASIAGAMAAVETRLLRQPQSLNDYLGTQTRRADADAQIYSNRQSKADIARTFGLGGEVMDELAPKSPRRKEILALRARQDEGMHAKIGSESSEKLKGLQEMIELELRRQKVMASPEGRKSLQEELLYGRSIETTLREQMILRAEQRGLYLASGEGKRDMNVEASQGHMLDVGKLRDEVALQKQRARYLASPEGKKILAEEGRLMAEQEKITRRARWHETAGRKGSFAADMELAGEKLEKLRREFDGFGKAGQRAFGTVSAGVLGLAAIADPVATFPTLMASINAFGIEVGATVLPIVNSLSAGFQQAAKYLRGMDEVFKSDAARIAIWVGAAGLAAAAIYKIITALAAMRAAMMTNPWTAGLTIGLTLVAALGAEYAILGDKASHAAQAMGAAGQAVLGTPGAARREMNLGQLLRQIGDDGVRAKIEDAMPGKDANDLGRGRFAQTLEREQKLAEEQAARIRKTLTGQKDAVELDRVEAGFVRRHAEELKKDAQPSAFRKALETKIGDPDSGFRGARDEAVEKYLKKLKEDFESKLPLDEDGGPFLARRPKWDEQVMRERLQAAARGEDYSVLRGNLKAGKDSDKLKAAEDTAAALKTLREQFGSGGDGKTIPSIKWPNAPQIMDPVAFGQALQVEALKGDDQAMINQQRQIELAEKQLAELEKANQKREADRWDGPRRR